MRKASKSGLYKTKIGMNITLDRGMFNYGSIRILCVGEIDDADVIEGSSAGANIHNLETIRLPEALKRERTEVYVGKTASR